MNNKLTVALGLTIVLCLTALPTSAADAQTAGEQAQQSIDEGRNAFGGGRHFPWYDAAKDDLQPITLKQPWQPWRLPSFSIRWLVWGLVALLLAALVFVLLRVAVRARLSRKPRLERDQPRILDPERIEALPFMAERPRDDLLGEARRQYELGNYSEAIIYLFSYELMQLDKNALIQLAKGKTNRQYLRETSRVRQLRELLELTIITFEGVFFGGCSLDRSGFEACWDRLGEFENLVTRAAT
jgi:hypothetical protein